MAVAMRERIQEKAASHLQPGEVIQECFAGQTVNPYWSLLSTLIILLQSSYRAVVVTDRRIIVFQSSRLGYSNIKRVLRDLPRGTRIGPLEGKMWAKTGALGEEMYIHRRFFKDVAAADAALG